MQDEINYQVMGFLYRGAKFGMDELTKTLSRACNKAKEFIDNNEYASAAVDYGKMSLKKLKESAETLSTVEISNDNIKDFEKIARKYNIDFALTKGKDEMGSYYIVFFKVKDKDSINNAVDELVSNKVNKRLEDKSKQDINKAIYENKEKAQDLNRVLEKVKTKNRNVSL